MNLDILSFPKEILETITSNFTSFGKDIQSTRSTCTLFRTMIDSYILWQIMHRIHNTRHKMHISIPVMNYTLDKKVICVLESKAKCVRPFFHTCINSLTNTRHVEIITSLMRILPWRVENVLQNSKCNFFRTIASDIKDLFTLLRTEPNKWTQHSIKKIRWSLLGYQTSARYNDITLNVRLKNYGLYVKEACQLPMYHLVLAIYSNNYLM